MDDFATRSAKLRQLRAEGKASVSYNVIIDEPQRAALLELLVANGLGGNGADGHALQYWQAMLMDLPAQEAETPGMGHGFCL